MQKSDLAHQHCQQDNVDAWWSVASGITAPLDTWNNSIYPECQKCTLWPSQTCPTHDQWCKSIDYNDGTCSPQYCKMYGKTDKACEKEYCQANPNDKSCPKYCKSVNETDPDCPGYCDTQVGEADKRCASHCQTQGSDDANCPQYCTAHPTDQGCACKANPNQKICNGWCDAHPDDKGCYGYCIKNAYDPECWAPTQWCTLHPDDKACSGYCKRNPNDPSCKPEPDPGPPPKHHPWYEVFIVDIELLLSKLEITWQYAGMVLLGALPVYKFTGLSSKAVLFVGIGLTGPFLLYHIRNDIFGTEDYVKWWEKQNPIETWLLKGLGVFLTGVAITGFLVYSESNAGFADFMENDTFELGILTSAIVAAGYLFETSTIGGGIVGFFKWLFGKL